MEITEKEFHPDYVKICKIEIAQSKFYCGFNETVRKLNRQENTIEGFTISPGNDEDSENILITTIIGAFDKKRYAFMLKRLLPKGADNCLGEGEIFCDEENKKWVFHFLWDKEHQAELSYPDGITLFHAYFNAFKKFMEEYAKEYKKEGWYQRFLKELMKLNEYYEEMVEKGEIEE